MGVPETLAHISLFPHSLTPSLPHPLTPSLHRGNDAPSSLKTP